MSSNRRWGALALVVTACLAGTFIGSRYGLPLVLLVVAGGLLLLIVASLWMSLLSLSGETRMTLDEALTTAAPQVEEERKRAVLRALKDLNYERRMGKVSGEDYAQLSLVYRQEARTLLVALDETMGPARKAAEQRILRRLRRAGLASRPSRAGEQEKNLSDPCEDSSGSSAAPGGPTRRCPDCGHRNQLSVDECEACKVVLAEGDHVLCRACPAVFSSESGECPMCGVARTEA